MVATVLEADADGFGANLLSANYSTEEICDREPGETELVSFIMLRRRVKEPLVLNDTKRGIRHQVCDFVESLGPRPVYEYGVLVTTLPNELFTLAQYYRVRADMENVFDELKNQWGWGGYTTKDLKRCPILARQIALIYNWWSLFVRLAIQRDAEANTSRPLLLTAVGTQTGHQGQAKLTLTSAHVKTDQIQRALQGLRSFFKDCRTTAEQLGGAALWRKMLSRIFVVAFKEGSFSPHGCSHIQPNSSR